MQTFYWDKLSDAEKIKALARPSSLTDANITQTVADIMTDVSARGDEAVLDYTRKFDAPIDNLPVSLASC